MTRAGPGRLPVRRGRLLCERGRLSEEVLALVSVEQPPRWFVIDCAAIDDLDYTGGKTLAELADQLRTRKITLALCQVSDKVRVELETFSITPKIGEDHIYDTAQDAIAGFHAAGTNTGAA